MGKGGGGVVGRAAGGKADEVVVGKGSGKGGADEEREEADGRWRADGGR